MQASVVLPWPSRHLSPNSRMHWKPRSVYKRQAREMAGWAVISAIPQEVRASIAQGGGKIPMRITFYPPDRRHRDDDNMIGAFKALRDGIADALLVNDRRFQPHYFFEDAEKPGRIEIHFTYPQADCAPLPCAANPEDLQEKTAPESAGTLDPGPCHHAGMERLDHGN